MYFFLITVGVIAILFFTFLLLGIFFYNFAIKRSPKRFLNQVLVNPACEDWLGKQVIETSSITSHDGLVLKGYKLNYDNENKRFVILVHGYMGHYQDMAEFAKLFYDYHFNVFMPDLRGHGSSEGDYIGMGYFDRLDILAWIKELIGIHGEEIEIMLLGVSMGGATVSFVSGEELPPQVKLIVSDCAFHDIKEILTYQMKKMYGIPAFPLLYFTSLVSKVRAGYSFENKSILEYVKKSLVPIVFIHGGMDRFVPTKMVYLLHDACKAEKRLLIVDQATHALSYRTDPEVYQNLLEQVIKAYIPR